MNDNICNNCRWAKDEVCNNIASNEFLKDVEKLELEECDHFFSYDDNENLNSKVLDDVSTYIDM